MMDLAPATIDARDGAAVMLAQAERWSPPKGHASWCLVERAPWMRTVIERRYNGPKVVRLSASCTCSRNAAARSLRKLAR